MSPTQSPAAAGEQPAPAKRVTLSQVVEKLLERGGSEHSSVTLTRNAKGEVQIEVIVRTAEHGDVQSVDQAADKARELFDSLRSHYPLSSGLVGAGPPA